MTTGDGIFWSTALVVGALVVNEIYDRIHNHLQFKRFERENEKERRERADRHS